MITPSLHLDDWRGLIRVYAIDNQLRLLVQIGSPICQALEGAWNASLEGDIATAPVDFFVGDGEEGRPRWSYQDRIEWRIGEEAGARAVESAKKWGHR